MIDLAPCPFCGLPPEIRDTGRGFKRIEHGTPEMGKRDPAWRCPAINWRCVDDQAEEIAAWNRRAHPASGSAPEGWKVKPLRWKILASDHLVAECPLGRYVVVRENWWLNHGTLTVAEGLEQAKLAADADYSQRILSALVPSAPEGWNEAIEAAAKMADAKAANYRANGVYNGTLPLDFELFAQELRTALLRPTDTAPSGKEGE